MSDKTPTEKTTWDVWSYDVWGNEEDGWTVNNRFNEHRDLEIECPVEVNNPNDPTLAFYSAYPTNDQIREALSLRKGTEIDLDGDDLFINVQGPDGYPLGELICTSHRSLSPIRKRGS